MFKFFNWSKSSGVKRLFVLSFKDSRVRKSYKQYFLPTVEIKNYNVMIDGRKFFDQPVKNDFRTYDNMRNISTSQVDDYTTGCWLDCPYFKKYNKLISIDFK